MIKVETVNEPKQVRKIYCDSCGADITLSEMITIERVRRIWKREKDSTYHTSSPFESEDVGERLEFCSKKCEKDFISITGMKDIKDFCV